MGKHVGTRIRSGLSLVCRHLKQCAAEEKLARFSVEAGNRRIPPPVETKVAACGGNEICLCVPNCFNKV